MHHELRSFLPSSILQVFGMVKQVFLELIADVLLNDEINLRLAVRLLV